MPTLVSASNVIERSLWTADDFLDWLKPGVKADLIFGEKTMHSPVNLRHARLLNFLDRLLAIYIERRDLGALYREAVAVRLSSRSVFLPDLVFLTKEQAALAGDTYIAFAPTLLVEALSPATAENDIGPKFAAYEEHGVQEYWILDPETNAHRFYARQGDLLVEYANCEPVIRAKTIPGLAMRREWLDANRAPTIEAALAAIESGLW